VVARRFSRSGAGIINLFADKVRFPHLCRAGFGGECDFSETAFEAQGDYCGSGFKPAEKSGDSNLGDEMELSK
jgi:hypothetical protein